MPDPTGEITAPESEPAVEPAPTEPTAAEEIQKPEPDHLTTDQIHDPPAVENTSNSVAEVPAEPTAETSVIEPVPLTEPVFPVPLVVSTPRAKLEPLIDPTLNIKEEKLFLNEPVKSGNGLAVEAEERPDQADMDGASALAALASAASIAQNTVKQETNGIKSEIDEVSSGFHLDFNNKFRNNSGSEKINSKFIIFN